MFDLVAGGPGNSIYWIARPDEDVAGTCRQCRCPGVWSKHKVVIAGRDVRAGVISQRDVVPARGDTCQRGVTDCAVA
jgi:hypothetical protein